MNFSRIVVVLLVCAMASCHSVPEVEASTECPDCGGTGYTDTIAGADCGASGEVKCTLCDGSGRTDPPCTICGGGREIPCSYCGESGVNADGTPCSHCEGTGHVVCPSCYGAHDKSNVCILGSLSLAGFRVRNAMAKVKFMLNARLVMVQDEYERIKQK